MAKPAVNSLMLSLLATILTVLGCGVMPAGQVSTKTFTVSGFTLPIAMAYSTAADVQAQVPGIASSDGGFDVLERQARSAFLPDAIISGILSQLTVKVTYVPMNCQRIALKLSDTVKKDEPKRVVVRKHGDGSLCYNGNEWKSTL
ncbi:hypothetical protein KIN20_020754 [Parelaphostrongylus tenuis]|uniref:Lipoprotein n=1 Tax=Parelaphostrongylus tenuis TaxID=148309 RepID=A0AAD5N3I8_PARTN|nr:hypothetical protein KIN20_020754 [Parelaphostrongylus tenuis]